MSATAEDCGVSVPPLVSLDAVFDELQRVKDGVRMNGTDLYEIGWRHGVGNCIDAIAHRFPPESQTMPGDQP